MKAYGLRVAMVLFGLGVVTPALGDVKGTWMADDGTAIRIHSCGSALCGDIASVPHSNGRPPTDLKNADPSRRNRPLVGVQVLTGMHPDGPGRWSGRLYNPKDGNTYDGNLIEKGPDTIRIEGCWLFFCGGQNLTRMKSSAAGNI
jgi:uncharacterized protein (DUF2147 family)